MKAFLAVFTIAIGLAAIVLGRIDDAPGGQVLGLLLIVGVEADSSVYCCAGAAGWTTILPQ
jgi:hypothetical protein